MSHFWIRDAQPVPLLPLGPLKEIYLVSVYECFTWTPVGGAGMKALEN